MLAAPVLARLYDPTDFGLLAVYAALLSVLLAVASLRYDAAIPIAGDAEEAVQLLFLSVVLAVAASLILGLVLLAWGAEIAAALGAPALRPLLWSSRSRSWSRASPRRSGGLAIQQRTFGPLGRMRAIQGLAQAIGQAVFGLLHAGPLGLILGDVAGRTFGMEQLVRPVWRTLRSAHPSRRCDCPDRPPALGLRPGDDSGVSPEHAVVQAPFLLYSRRCSTSARPASSSSRTGCWCCRRRSSPRPSARSSSGRRPRRGIRRLHDLACDVAVSLLAFSIPTYLVIVVAGRP